MKICIRSQNDGWVIDEIANDFRRYTRHQIVNLNENSDLVWAINPFAFSSIVLPASCKSVLQMHHIDTDKLPEYDFASFNKAHFCVVPNKITAHAASQYLKIPITVLPYWLLSKNLAPKNAKKALDMKKEICPNGEILIGSFVKDGNGKNGDTPKSAKNPNLFLNVVERLNTIMKIKVLLAGYAREYVKSKLDAMKIPYAYYQKYPDTNILYDCLDWYLVTSKYEGGPQAALEASYRGIKILSTDVGMASEVLDKECICNNADEFVDKIRFNVNRTTNNYNSVRNYLPSVIVPKYDDYFEGL